LEGSAWSKVVRKFFGNLLGGNPNVPECYKYDLRELHMVCLSRDTWDGYPNPSDGTKTLYYFYRDKCLFIHARYFVDGSREARNKEGDEGLVILLFDLKDAFDKVCKFIGEHLENSALGVFETEIDIGQDCAVLVEHPTWLNLLAAIQNTEHRVIEIETNCETDKIIVRFTRT
jgi:hypothetical protein